MRSAVLDWRGAIAAGTIAGQRRLRQLALCQAADLTGARLGSTTRDAHTLIRRHSPFLAVDRPLDVDIECVATLLRAGELRRTVGPPSST